MRKSIFSRIKMTLARQVGLLLVCGYGLMAACVIGTLSHFQFAESLKIEHQLARKDLSQLMVSLDKLKARLIAHHEEWSHWDDAYSFVQGENPQFKDDYLDLIDGLTLVTYYLYIDAEHRVAASGLRDYKAGTVLPLPPDTKEQVLAAYQKLSQRGEDKTQHAGLILIDGSLYFLCVGAITPNSDGAAPPLGALIFTLQISHEMLAQISQEMELPLDLVTRSDSRFQETLQTYSQHKLPDAPVALTFTPDEYVHAAGLLADVDENPAAFVTTYAPEHIYARSKQSFQFVFFMICLFAIGSMILSQVIIKKYLVSPLEIVSKHLNDVSEKRESNAHLKNPGGLELGIIVNGMNKAFAALGALESELRASRDTAVAANEAKSSFVAKVSHELRTPIHGILGLLRIIKKNVADESARTQLGMVRDSTVGLLGVVNDILDFSKAEVGNLSVSPAPMKLRETVRTALRVIAPRVFERAESDLIECAASIDPTIPDELIGDSKRISQLLVNLLSNAVKFTKRGAVSLIVRRGGESPHGETIEFTVIDTGIGIPADKLDLVFEPFKQADDSVSRQYSGTGLGLAIVKQLIEMMHGSVSVSSEVGKGSTFTLSIPLQYVGVSTVAQTPLNSTYVWIINNASKETELIGRALKQVRVNAWCDSTDTLISEKSRTPAVSAVECLIVAGNTLVSPETWKIIQNMAALRTPDNIVVTLSPHELSYREKLLAIGISKIILTPLIAEDILDVIRGQYKENYAGYDDYLEDEKPSQKSGLTMLVADDIITNQIVIRSMLQKLGHEVVVVSNGKEALDTIGHQLGLRPQTSQDKLFDMVFMDVQMPVMDGLEAIRRIRAREKVLGRQGESLLPIIAVTAHAFTEEHTRMIDAGADGILSKPIEDRDLLSLIARHQRSSRSLPQPVSPSENTPALTKPGVNAITRILETLETLDAQIAKTCGIYGTTEGHTFVDGKKLQRRSDNDLALCKELLSSFQSTASDMLEELHCVASTQDMGALEKAAHTLKGSLSEMGCERGSSLAAEIVSLCRNKQHSEALAKLSDLLPVVQSTSTVLSGALACFDVAAI